MKTYKITGYIAGLLFLAASISSCSDEWIETRPKDLVTFEDFWQTHDQLKAAIAGCYMSMANDDRYGSGQPFHGVVGKMIQWGEIRGDNVVPTTSAMDEEVKMATCNIIPENKVCSWNDLYTVINNCNTVLDNADLVLENDQTLTEADVNVYKAEALAIRSLMYFYLVRTYKEVPLVLVSSKTSTQNYDIAKSSEEQIIQQIIDDLILAKSMSVNSYDNNSNKYFYDKGRFTKAAITTLLADVYLWAGRYAECVAACNEVLHTKSIKLVIPSLFYGGSEWLDMFWLGNSNESIFEIQYGNSLEGKTNNMLYQCYGSISATEHFRAPVDPTTWSLNTLFKKEGAVSDIDYDLKDIRHYLSYNSTSSGLASALITKFPYSTGLSANWIVYRLAEVYFMKAEALLYQDYQQNKNEIVHLINTIYMRAHPEVLPADTVYVASKYTTQQELVDLLLKEKQKEFLFEGKRWYDLLRASRREAKPMRIFNEYVVRNINYNYRELAVSKLYNEWARYLPVPYNDMKVNPLLVQNPFYVTTIEE